MLDNEQLRAGYHDILRREILELVPTSAKTILDLGCGTGVLGKKVKERQACRFDGIELNKEAADLASKNLDTVFQDNLNRFDPAFLKRKYDCIILADILEHLIAPWDVLQKFASILTDDGVVVASVPNIAHPYIIAELQRGLFRYQPAGLLDVTHLRFFTKTTISQLLYRAGLKLTSIDGIPSTNNPIQYRITAKKPTVEHKDPLATILILTCNAWEYTAQCLASIKSMTEVPYKILVIDNGSTDGTVERLREDDSIFHVESDYNLGFARGFNIGLEMIDTPYFVISNSDVVVTHHWLKRLTEHINDDDKLVGIGPCTNYASGPQLIKDTNYDTEKTLQEYAERFSTSSKTPVEPFFRLVFFLVLFKTIVLPTVGLLDEQYEGGNFEDDDYCLRVIGNKFKLAIDYTVFIHHYGHRTFKANNLDLAKALEINKKRFMKKWNLSEQSK